MSPEDHRIFTLFAERVRALEPRARAWAFGSRARGDAEEFSDLDVCVVAPEVTPEFYQAVGQEAWEIGFENEVFIQDVLFSEHQFDEGPMSASPLVKNILREGIAA
jgi:predicted nucleotidyltransferase